MAEQHGAEREEGRDRQDGPEERHALPLPDGPGAVTGADGTAGQPGPAGAAGQPAAEPTAGPGAEPTAEPVAGAGASPQGGAATGAAAGTGGRLDEEAAWAAIVAGYGEEPPDPPGARPFRSVEDLALPEFDARAEGDRPARGASADDRRKADGWKVDSRKAEDRTTADGTTGDRTTGDRTTDGRDAGDGTAKARTEGGGDAAGDTAEDDGRATAARPVLGGSVVFAPGVGPRGPRDYQLADPDAPAGGEGAATPAEGDDDEGHFVPPEPPPLPEADSAAKFGWLGVLGGPVLMLLAVLLQWDMTWWLTTLCVGGFLGGFATLVSRMRDEEEDGDDDPGRGAVV